MSAIISALLLAGLLLCALVLAAEKVEPEVRMRKLRKCPKCDVHPVFREIIRAGGFGYVAHCPNCSFGDQDEDGWSDTAMAAGVWNFMVLHHLEEAA